MIRPTLSAIPRSVRTGPRAAKEKKHICYTVLRGWEGL